MTLAPMGIGGALIVAALMQTAHDSLFDLEMSSGTDGAHSGPSDPHPLGNAIDVHTHGLSTQQKHDTLQRTMDYLGHLGGVLTSYPAAAIIVETSGGLANGLFFGFLEDADTPNEHLHFQLRHVVRVQPAQVIRA